jgi:hypothetical protein
MKKTLLKLLWGKNNKTSVILSSAGLFIGFFVVLIAVNIYLMVNNTIKSDETLFSNDYIVVNKKVSILNTIKFANSDFSETELEELRNQPFVKDLALFTSNTFKIGAFTEATRDIPGFYTELFFQSVPDKYLKINDKRWNWNPETGEIPIIFPGDYLRLYNFGFAKSQGLPQISAETIGKVSFKVKVKGRGETGIFSARIIGLTDKVNSILVPEEFMNWANRRFGNPEEAGKTSMVLIETGNPADPAIFTYLKNHNLETNSERLKNSKSTVFLKLLFTIMISIGLIITFLSLLLFLLSFDLIIFKSSEEIKKLYLIGYHSKAILKYYAGILGFVIFVLGILVLSAVIISQSVMVDYFGTAGFYVESPGFPVNLSIVIAMSVIVFVINIAGIGNRLKRLRRP